MTGVGSKPAARQAAANVVRKAAESANAVLLSETNLALCGDSLGKAGAQEGLGHAGSGHDIKREYSTRESDKRHRTA